MDDLYSRNGHVIFDISILMIEDGVFEVLATNGDTFLGGDDFDEALISHWIKTYEITTADLSDKTFTQRLRLMAESAKKALSEEDNFEAKVGAYHLSITKSGFEELIRPLIQKTIELCKACIK